MISINFCAFWDAPPIKKPSILLISFKFVIFLGFTEPPYKTFGGLSLNLPLINSTVLKRSFDFGIIPLPMAHTGSYAKNILDLSYDQRNNLEACGDKSLMNRIKEVQPILMLFGHLHNNKDIVNAGTRKVYGLDTIFSNGSVVTDGKFGKLSSQGNILEIIK